MWELRFQLSDWVSKSLESNFKKPVGGNLKTEHSERALAQQKGASSNKAPQKMSWKKMGIRIMKGCAKVL